MTGPTDHGHPHRHHDEDESHVHGSLENPWAGQGAVLLDIGGDIGALVVVMPAGMDGVEVEIRPARPGAQSAGEHPHVAVVARPVRAGTVSSLVFPELTSGTYELYEKGTTRVDLTARVEGGHVTQATWPTLARTGHGGAPAGDRDTAG
jgi:hypothetical protein